MKNRLRSIDYRNRLLSPTEADVWFTMVPEHITPTTEVHGRLTGPRCLFATTVEIAYPLRPVPGAPEGLRPLTKRVIIPEPSLWDPQSPFVYQADVELWQDGEPCDRARFDVGLTSLTLGPRGLRCNGRPLAIQGTASLPSPDDVQRLRQAGYNLLVAPLEGHAPWWTTANRYGFLMLGRLPPTASALSLAHTMGGQVCALGWILEQPLPGTSAPEEWLNRLRARGHLIGIELDRPPTSALPDWLSFVVAPEAALSTVSGINLPKLVVREASSAKSDQSAEAVITGILGWIDL